VYILLPVCEEILTDMGCLGVIASHVTCIKGCLFPQRTFVTDKTLCTSLAYFEEAS
jgi:hypothetical protein